jgi:adenosylcobinamide kinase / adenosylcobinamide-phosphate guanylyltransferase
MGITLIGGGSRSGKSAYALTCARKRGTRLAFIATAQALDEEMHERVTKHQADRGPEFKTYEEPLAVPTLIQTLGASFEAIVVDCLTLWLSNLLLAGSEQLESEYRNLVEASSAAQSSIIFVTNEVGSGIVPDNCLARRFRDEAGRLNQAVAAAAAEVYWMVFGIPLCIKQTKPV